MLNASEIGTAGEIHATNWLQNKGYRCTRNTQLPGATDIEANGINVSLLVQVKAAVWPNLAAFLSAEENRAIVNRANRTGRQAWLARLQVNNSGALLGEIAWTKLN